MAATARRFQMIRPHHRPRLPGMPRMRAMGFLVEKKPIRILFQASILGYRHIRQVMVVNCLRGGKTARAEIEQWRASKASQVT